MSQGLSAHRAYFNEYASSQPYEYKQTYSSSMQTRTGGNIPQKESQSTSPYAIDNLPIIYDDASRTGTPMKGSSRIVYAQKQQYLSSPVSKFETMPFNQSKPIPDPTRTSYQTHESTQKVETFISNYTSSKYGSSGMAYPLDEGKSASRTIIEELSSGEYRTDMTFPQAKVMSYRMVQPINHENIVQKITAGSIPTGQKNQIKDYKPEIKTDYRIDRKIDHRVEQAEKNGSRLLMEKINQDLPPGLPPRSVHSYVANEIIYGPISQIPARNNASIPVVNNSYGMVSTSQPIPNINSTYTFQNIPQSSKTINVQTSHQAITNNIVSSLPSQTANPAQFQQKSYSNTVQTNTNTSTTPVNNFTFMGDHNSHEHSTTMMMGVQSGRHLSLQTVPRIQYDRCVTECKNWETKYNQLYLKYMNLATTTSMAANNPQLQMLRQQNMHLRRSVKQQSQMSAVIKNNSKNASVLQSRFNELVQAQREATIKQCMLLLQRYKLECKQPAYDVSRI